LKRKTAEVSSAVPFHRRQASTAGTRRAGLRRPRFSFFRFTCQTARNLRPRLGLKSFAARLSLTPTPRLGREKRRRNRRSPHIRRGHGLAGWFTAQTV